MATFARSSHRSAASSSPSAVAGAAGSAAATTSNNTNSNNTNTTEANNAENDIMKEKEANTQKYLTNCKSLYSCIHCRTHLANHDELVSRSFQGNHGRAYLFNSVINISCGQPVQRQLNTGSHAVADIFCSNCEKVLGWKYEKAFVETQKYKEGKYIIELAHVVRENKHLELDKGEIFLSRQMSGKSKQSTRGSTSSNNNNLLPPLRPNSLTYSPQSSQMSSPTDSAIGGDSLDYDDYNHNQHHHRQEQHRCGSCDQNDNDEDEDYVDEELMFPFYDDLCSSRSSYPGNLSMSQHDRARRSLYLSSKPYDWKAPSSSSASPRLSRPTSSVDDHLLASPSCSSNTTSSSARSANREYAASRGCLQKQLQDVCRLSNNEQPAASERPARQLNHKSDNSHNYGKDNNQQRRQQSRQEDAETQFKLDDGDEDDDLAPGNQQQESDDDRLRRHHHRRHHLQGAPGSSSKQTTATAGRSSSETVTKLSEADNNQSSGKQQQQQASTIKVDDEEFYDCYSEHDVMNTLNWCGDSKQQSQHHSDNL